MAVNFAVRLNGTLIGEAVLYNFDYRAARSWAAGSISLCRKRLRHRGFPVCCGMGSVSGEPEPGLAKCYKENEASYKMLSACMRRNGEDETSSILKSWSD